MTEENGKICFVIAPIGNPESEIRKRSDQILRYIISPAVEPRGYKAVRADELDKPGLITSQVIQHVVEDPLVVADLTGRNPNVFYELAIRHAIRKPIIQIISRDENIPFDVAGTRTIFVDHHDLDNVASAKASISEQIDALEKDSSYMETPISVSLDLQRLRQSDDPEQRTSADVISALSNLTKEVMASRAESRKFMRDLEKLQGTLMRNLNISNREREYFKHQRHRIGLNEDPTLERFTRDSVRPPLDNTAEDELRW